MFPDGLYIFAVKVPAPVTYLCNASFNVKETDVVLPSIGYSAEVLQVFIPSPVPDIEIVPDMFVPFCDIDIVDGLGVSTPS